MSLLVWLPLNGDLKNRGLSNTVFTDYGVSKITTDGKIGGGCYYTNEKTLFVILRAIHASVFKLWVLSFYYFFLSLY